MVVGRRGALVQRRAVAALSFAHVSPRHFACCFDFCVSFYFHRNVLQARTRHLVVVARHAVVRCLCQWPF